MVNEILSRIRGKLGARSAPEQVEDDYKALEDAIAGLQAADRIYHPGPYWERYREPLQDYLRKHGLRDYRLGDASENDPKYILRRFGAGEPRVPPPTHVAAKEWDTLRYKFAESYGQLMGSMPLSKLEICTAGNPGDLFRVRGRFYTTNVLNFYMRYAYLCQFIDFNSISVIAEIGPGSGLQTEILHKLHPQLASYLFDIPPQSYITNQYLKHVFPGKVVGINETKDLKAVPPKEPGRIYIFNSWQAPLVRRLNIDLFWNAASFNEMEPDLVANYLHYFAPQSKRIYLMSIMEGSRVGLEDYHRLLKSHECRSMVPLQLVDGRLSLAYRNSLWWKRRVQGAVS